ncbi:class I SAM-dependent methyltransferase [Corallococcus exiguus]|uniref:50S ribosomal protein L11 methyltransferase n=1 Tax=Corallococcus TaxID=83461 RepID=UPI000EA2EC7E|nr:MULTISPECIES: class I SAM-dependent methyltransferase [Corallococcus]NRD64127.1 class I SAM-dependent methyltransferase [Corallococcus exiguus]RKH29384.1 class I SAM-dependent methyltransferase [Corallococcus sp. CA041A]
MDRPRRPTASPFEFPPEAAFTWHSESDEPAPTRLSPVDDGLSADTALKRVRRGEFLRYSGDFHNAKQLLGALGRRLERPWQARSPLEAFRAERRARQLEHATLSRIVVALDRGYRLDLARAPDVAEACRQVWGEPTEDFTVVPLKQLLGMLGAAEWRRKGLEVPGLKGLLHPHYGVYLPTRTDYVELLAAVSDVKGKRVFDVGTGTGVLSFLLLQRGAAFAQATDCDSRAVACARENAERLGLSQRFQVTEADLFPEGKADLVVCNPPWIPEPPKNRVDRAVFDEDSQFLRRFLEGLPSALNPGGEGLLILSDLAVLLGLRPAGWIEEQFERCGLTVAWRKSTPARHSKAKDKADPLHAARSQEVTTLYGLVPTAR